MSELTPEKKQRIAELMARLRTRAGWLFTDDEERDPVREIGLLLSREDFEERGASFCNEMIRRAGEADFSPGEFYVLLWAMIWKMRKEFRSQILPKRGRIR